MKCQIFLMTEDIEPAVGCKRLIRHGGRVNKAYQTRQPGE